MIQGFFVAACVLLAIAFMGRRFYRTLTKKGGCHSDCDISCKSRSCAGGAECPHQKSLVELKPLKKPRA